MQRCPDPLLLSVSRIRINHGLEHPHTPIFRTRYTPLRLDILGTDALAVLSSYESSIAFALPLPRLCCRTPHGSVWGHRRVVKSRLTWGRLLAFVLPLSIWLSAFS